MIMPDSLHSLLEYLRENNHVQVVYGTARQNRKYETYKDGNIWWKLDDGTPKKTSAMSMLADGILVFDDKSFTFQAYGAEMRFEYNPGRVA